MNLLEFYALQSILSDPGKYTYLLEELSSDPSVFSAESFRFVINDFLAGQACLKVPEEYKEDMNIQSLEKRLKMVILRSDEDKIGYTVGNCRDISLFICSVFRLNHTPARVRSGFATFFDPVKKFDHWICEYWNYNKKSWQWIDGWMLQVQQKLDILPEFFRDSFASLGMNPLDVKPRFFMSGGEAWRRCRKGEDYFENYGTTVEGLQGKWFLRDNLIRDLFCMNKVEPLPWDCWGEMGRHHTDLDNACIRLLDEVAVELDHQELNFETLKTLYFKLSPKQFSLS